MLRHKLKFIDLLGVYFSTLLLNSEFTIQNMTGFDYKEDKTLLRLLLINKKQVRKG